MYDWRRKMKKTIQNIIISLEVILLVLFLIQMSSCNLFLSGPSGDESVVVSEDDVLTAGGADGAPSVDDGFNYQTLKWIQVLVNSDVSDVDIHVYDEGNKMIASVKTDSRGAVNIMISVTGTSSGLYIRSATIGLPSEVYIEIVDNIASLDLRRSSRSSNSVSARSSIVNRAVLDASGSYQQTPGFPEFSVIGNWNNKGVPDYLDTPETISSAILSEINSILPEKQPVPEYRPQYLDANLDTDLHITQNAEVFVSFVHEGAGYRNSLGFYTYTTVNGPPSNIGAQDITLIFPNVSYRYSGGGLYSGDTVQIGSFLAGTSIGWVLLSNAYSTRFEAVSNGINTFYSESSLNPDASPYQQHLIQIDLGEIIVLGFEDLLRPGGDNDFNDAVFTIRSNPVGAIDRSGLVTDTSVNYTAPAADDGGIQLQDQPLFDISGYQFFPGLDEFGTLAFEDLWPHKGDYDFNDLVIDYNVVETLDNSNKIIQIQISLKIVGILASMHNGFGFQLGIPPELVASVTGGRYTKGYTQLEGNGVEKRQQKAVIIAFEDAQAHYNESDPDNSELMVLSINLLQGVSRSEIGFAPYNPFIMSNGERGREVHLPGYKPTSLVHIPYFGSQDDDSVLGTGYMYKTDEELPWALHLPELFAYPPDSVQISDAFLLFLPWVYSNGVSDTDWYSDKPGYRNPDITFRG